MKNGSSNERFKYSENVVRFTPVAQRLHKMREKINALLEPTNDDSAVLYEMKIFKMVRSTFVKVILYFISPHTRFHSLWILHSVQFLYEKNHRVPEIWVKPMQYKRIAIVETIHPLQWFYLWHVAYGTHCAKPCLKLENKILEARPKCKVRRQFGKGVYVRFWFFGPYSTTPCSKQVFEDKLVPWKLQIEKIKYCASVGENCN